MDKSIVHGKEINLSVWIKECSAPPVDSKCYTGGRNYTFCPIFMKNRGRNTTFFSFLLKYRGRNYTNFPETWNGGAYRWRLRDCSNSSALAMELLQSYTQPSICGNLHIVSNPHRSSSYLHNDNFNNTYRTKTLDYRRAVGPQFEEGAFPARHVIDFSATGGILVLVRDVTEKAVAGAAQDSMVRSKRIVLSRNHRSYKKLWHKTVLIQNYLLPCGSQIPMSHDPYGS